MLFLVTVVFALCSHVGVVLLVDPPICSNDESVYQLLSLHMLGKTRPPLLSLDDYANVRKSSE